MAQGIMNQIGLPFGSPSNNGVVIGPTTSGGPLQFINAPGGSGLVLTSVSGSAPTWQSPAAIGGFTFINAVRVATTGALNATYSNGSSGVGATLTNAGTQAAIVIDGVTLSSGDRVLVHNQSSAFQNGVYTATILGSVSTNWVLTRATDYDTIAQILYGDFVVSVEGTANANVTWTQQDVVATIGTDAIAFSKATASISATAYSTLTASSTGAAIVGVSPGAVGNVLLSAGSSAAPAYTSSAYVTPATSFGVTVTVGATNLTAYASAPSGGPITLTLTNTPAVSDKYRFVGITNQGYVLQLQGTQVAQWVGGFNTTAGGTVTPSDPFATIEMEYVSSNLWVITNASSQLTFA